MVAKKSNRWTASVSSHFRHVLCRDARQKLSRGLRRSFPLRTRFLTKRDYTSTEPDHHHWFLTIWTVVRVHYIAGPPRQAADETVARGHIKSSGGVSCPPIWRLNWAGLRTVRTILHPSTAAGENVNKGFIKMCRNKLTTKMSQCHCQCNKYIK